MKKLYGLFKKARGEKKEKLKEMGAFCLKLGEKEKT